MYECILKCLNVPVIDVYRYVCLCMDVYECI